MAEKGRSGNSKEPRTIVHALPAEPLSEALLDEIVAESFPASDPPPWTLGRAAQEYAAQARNRKRPGEKAPVDKATKKE